MVAMSPGASCWSLGVLIAFCCRFYLIFRRLLATAHGGQLSWQHSCFLLMSVTYVHACTMCCCLGGLSYVMTLHCCSFVLHGILRWCVSSLVSAMPKVKQGWKGGPPPARRHSTRLTRPPARLVEATLDSSDSDVDTDVLRATNSDLQRRIQALEAQLSEVDRSGQHSVEPSTSALTALPLLDMAPASSTPGPAPQPGTSSTASQDTDYQALLAGALQHLSGATPLTPKQGESPMTPFLLLGATLDPKIKAMIWAHQYIELGSLASAAEPTVSWTLDPHSQLPQPHVAPARVTPVSTFSAWLRAFCTYASVYVERHPSEAASLFSYIVRIQDMDRRHGGLAWRTYDEKFRRIHALLPSMPWHTTNWDLAMDAVHGDTTRVTAFRRPSPFRLARRPPGSASSAVCFAWNDGRCANKQCRYRHACSVCGRPGHTRSTCWTTKPNNKPTNSGPSPPASSVPGRIRKG